MTLHDDVEQLVTSLDEQGIKALKKSLRLGESQELPSIETLTDICVPTYIGPTWQTDDDGEWVLPEHTLGWDLAVWSIQHLTNPNDPDLPWEFTSEQLRFLLWWYAVDKDGRFTSRRGVLQRLKGWGKDPLLAVICLIELLAPCRFAGWSDDGNPVGKPVVNPLVQIAAVTQEQSRNTGDMFPVLLKESTIDAYNIKVGIELVRTPRGRIQMLTSNPKAMEGKRVTFAVLNEVHQWVASNGGPEMYAAISRNLAKIPNSRFLAITNAYMPGENSVGEALREDYDKSIAEQGKANMLYDSVEADPRAPIMGPLVQLVLPGVRGDAVWLDLRAIEDEMATRTISIALSRRFWLNQIVTADDHLFGPEDWDHLGSLDYILRRGEKIALGFDGGRTDDATALVAIRLRDMCVFPLRIWEMDNRRRADKEVIDYAEVDGKVHQAFDMYDVHAFYADVSGWESYIQKWTQKFVDQLGIKASERSPIGLDMRGNQSRITKANMALITTIRQGHLKHNSDRILRKHVLNVVGRENTHGMSFGKESRESPHKVDGYAAMLLAYMAATDAQIRSKKETEVRRGRTFILT